MARTTDRMKISEAARTQTLWRREAVGVDPQFGPYVAFVTDYDERLYVQYGNAGQVKSATYTHWDADGTIVSREPISKRKRDRVLELLTQKDVCEES